MSGRRLQFIALKLYGFFFYFRLKFLFSSFEDFASTLNLLANLVACGGLDPNNDQIPSGPHCIQLGRCCATPWGCSYDGSSVSDLSSSQRHKKRKIHIQKSRRNATQNPWIDVYITITTKGVNRIGEEKRSVRV